MVASKVLRGDKTLSASVVVTFVGLGKGCSIAAKRWKRRTDSKQESVM